MYMQFGWAAFDETIQVSLHPVEPSFGMHRLQLVGVGDGQVVDDLPGRAEHRRALLERALGLGVVVPVLADDRLLLLEQRDGRVELRLVRASTDP